MDFTVGLWPRALNPLFINTPLSPSLSWKPFFHFLPLPIKFPLSFLLSQPLCVHLILQTDEAQLWDVLGSRG